MQDAHGQNKDIKELNYMYLVVVAKALARDTPAAIANFGLRKDFAEALAHVSVLDLQRISDTGHALLRPAIPAEALDGLLKANSDASRAAIATLTAID